MLFEFTSKSNRRGGPLLKLAEERGFEPRRPREESTHFPGVPVQPLLHSSLPTFYFTPSNTELSRRASIAPLHSAPPPPHYLESKLSDNFVRLRQPLLHSSMPKSHTFVITVNYTTFYRLLWLHLRQQSAYNNNR